MNDHRHDDPVLASAIEELRRIPAIDPRAIERVVGAAAIARVTPADEPLAAAPTNGTFGRRAWSVAGIAAAAAIVGFMLRGAWSPSVPSTPAAPVARSAATPMAAGATQLKSVANTPVVSPLPHQFVIKNGSAHRISVVGDFNQWDASRSPMIRSTADGLWSAVVPLMPGRHVYAFMVDDSVLVLDPREATARDPDLGTNASVVLVGRP